MKLSQIAIQLYTLRDHLKTPAEIAATLKKVRRIGYETVQISGMGPIPEADLMAICRGEGLSICGTHESGKDLFERPQAVADRLHQLDCRLTAYPYPSGVDFADAASVSALISNLDKAGEILRGAGCSLSYHNHAIEFLRSGNGTILEQIYAETNPDNLKAELDTYWIQYGGGDVVEWCRRLSGRLPWLHCKDYAFTAANTPAFAEVGSGNLDWPAILATAETGGCEWFIVEQDTCPGEPFVSIQKSFEYLKTNFCQ